MGLVRSRKARQVIAVALVVLGATILQGDGIGFDLSALFALVAAVIVRPR
jgi:threonine/homoserine efflux transporter RhtA